MTDRVRYLCNIKVSNTEAINDKHTHMEVHRYTGGEVTEGSSAGLPKTHPLSETIFSVPLKKQYNSIVQSLQLELQFEVAF